VEWAEALGERIKLVLLGDFNQARAGLMPGTGLQSLSELRAWLLPSMPRVLRLDTTLPRDFLIQMAADLQDSLGTGPDGFHS
jgi:hypothetical protein